MNFSLDFLFNWLRTYQTLFIARSALIINNFSSFMVYVTPFTWDIYFSSVDRGRKVWPPAVHVWHVMSKDAIVEPKWEALDGLKPVHPVKSPKHVNPVFQDHCIHSRSRCTKMMYKLPGVCPFTQSLNGMQHLLNVRVSTAIRWIAFFAAIFVGKKSWLPPVTSSR